MRDLVGRTSLDLPTFEHEHELAVLEQRDLWRRRRKTREVAPRTLGRLGVLAGKNSREVFGLDRVLQRDRDRRSRHARRTAAYGIDDDESRALCVLELSVDLFGRPELFDSQTRQVLSHWGDE